MWGFPVQGVLASRTALDRPVYKVAIFPFCHLPSLSLFPFHLFLQVSYSLRRPNMARKGVLFTGALLLTFTSSTVAQAPGYESPQVYPSSVFKCPFRLAG